MTQVRRRQVLRCDVVLLAFTAACASSSVSQPNVAWEGSFRSRTYLVGHREDVEALPEAHAAVSPYEYHADHREAALKDYARLRACGVQVGQRFVGASLDRFQVGGTSTCRIGPATVRCVTGYLQDGSKMYLRLAYSHSETLTRLKVDAMERLADGSGVEAGQSFSAPDRVWFEQLFQGLMAAANC